LYFQFCCWLKQIIGVALTDLKLAIACQSRKRPNGSKLRVIYRTMPFTADVGAKVK
jgi:hypothetical protein